MVFRIHPRNVHMACMQNSFQAQPSLPLEAQTEEGKHKF